MCEAYLPPSSLWTSRFLDASNEQESLYRVASDGSFFKSASGGVDNVLPDEQTPQDIKTKDYEYEGMTGDAIWRIVSLQVGTYAFVSDNAKSCFLFKIPTAKEMPRLLEEQKCFAKPSSACVISNAVAMANDATDEAERVELVVAIARGLAKNKAVAQALQVIATVKGRSQKANALDLVAIATIQADSQDDAGARTTLAIALEIARSSQEPVQRALLLPTIALQYARIGERARAVDILLEARDSAAQVEIKNMAFPGLFVSIAHAQADIDDVQAALATVAQMVKVGSGLKNLDGYRFNALTSITRTLATSGNVDGARRALSQALESLPPIEAATISAASLVDLAQLQEKLGGDHATQQRIQEMIDSIESKGRAGTKWALAEAYAENGQIQHSLKLFEEILPVYRSADSEAADDDIIWRMVALAETRAKTGDKAGAAGTAHRAMELAGDIAWAPARARCQEKIGEAFALADDKHSALIAFQRAIESVHGIRAETLKYPSEIYGPLLAVAAGQHALGESDAASRTIRIALDVASSLPAASESSQAFASVAVAQAAMGYNLDSLDTAKLALTTAAQVDSSDSYLRRLKIEVLADVSIALLSVAR
jgi:tetratricopeptide (TPR) repeat protein